MDKKDMETLSRFQQIFSEDAEKINPPDTLSRDSIVALLEKAENEKVVPIAEGKRKSFRPFGKIAAVAACFLVILGIAAVARNTAGRNDLGIKNAFEGFKIDGLIKKITSKEELDIEVSEIIEDNRIKDETVPAGAPESPSSESVKSGEENAVVVEKPEKGSAAVNNSAKAADIVKYCKGCLYVLTPAIDEKTSMGTQVIKVIDVSGAKMKEVSAIALYESGAVSLSDECLEMYINGNTLAAIISRRDFSGSSSGRSSRNSTVTLYYDISDPAAPSLIKTQEQEGSYICSGLRNGRLYLITTGSVSDANPAPSLSVDGRKFVLSADREEITACENARENAYLFITETNTADTAEEASMIEILGCGANSEITACDSGIYIARQLSAVETGEMRTEIYFVSGKPGRLSLQGTYSFEGGLCAPVSAYSDTGVCLVCSAEGKMIARILTEDLKSVECEKELDFFADLPVVFIGSTAFVSDGETGYAVQFGGNDIQVLSSLPHSGAKTYSLTGGGAVEITEPSGNGQSEIRYYPENGESIKTFTLNEGTRPLIDDERALIIDSDSGSFAIPVIKSDGSEEQSAYMLFRVSGADLTFAGEFIHESSFAGDAATRAVIAGDTLYTVSGAKIKAFSVAQGSEKEAYAY